jgi:hypothetical protein
VGGGDDDDDDDDHNNVKFIYTVVTHEINTLVMQ